MKRVLLWFTIAAVLVIGVRLHPSRSKDQLNVTPDAEREIDRAKRR